MSCLNSSINTNTFTKLIKPRRQMLNDAEKIARIRISPTFVVIEDPKKVNGVITQIPLSGHIFLFEDANEEAIYEIYPFQIMIDLGKVPNMKGFFTREYLGLYDLSRRIVSYFKDNKNLTSIGTIDGAQYRADFGENIINMVYTMEQSNYGIIESKYVTNRPSNSSNIFDIYLLKSLRGYRYETGGSDVLNLEPVPYRNLVNIMVLTREDMHDGQLPMVSASTYFMPLYVGSFWSYKIPRRGSTGPGDDVYGIMVEVSSKRYNPCETKKFIMRRWVRDPNANQQTYIKWIHMYDIIDSKALRKCYGMDLSRLRNNNLRRFTYIKETTGSMSGRNIIDIATTLDKNDIPHVGLIVKIEKYWETQSVDGGTSSVPTARRQITFRGSERQRRAGDTGRSSMMMMPTPEIEAMNETNANNKRRANFQSPVPMLETVSEDVKKYREEQTEEEAFLCIICGRTSGHILFTLSLPWQA